LERCLEDEVDLEDDSAFPVFRIGRLFNSDINGELDWVSYVAKETDYGAKVTVNLYVDCLSIDICFAARAGEMLWCGVCEARVRGTTGGYKTWEGNS
jgi:hypothetical protein